MAEKYREKKSLSCCGAESAHGRRTVLMGSCNNMPASESMASSSDGRNCKRMRIESFQGKCQTFFTMFGIGFIRKRAM